MPWLWGFVLKPIVVVWAGLNFVDDLALMIRLSRLGLAFVIPGKGQDSTEMCNVCDDVMGDLIAGTDGLQAIPCRQACLGVRRCIDMCEAVQEASETSTEFPCVAAGFCQADEYVDSLDMDCQASGILFGCQPKQYCRRVRHHGWKWSCQLKPGIGRWNGLQHMAGAHTVALVRGLNAQMHCGEPGAGEFCIAKPKGLGVIAEWLGYGIALCWGGIKSIQAIETPGGNDDRQWLTFWLILALFSFVEHFFARVVLSHIPLYYETKLLVLLWLAAQSGAEACYRKLRRLLQSMNVLISSDQVAAQKELDMFKTSGGDVVERQLAEQRNKTTDEKAKQKPNQYWEHDYGDLDSSSTSSWNASEQLYELSKFLLSSRGAKELEESTQLSQLHKGLLLERAAQVVSFQPRFLRIRLLGTIDETQGELPIMDKNSQADAYVICQLVPSEGRPYPPKGVLSRTIFRTRKPQWNQELEIPLKGGTVSPDGYFLSEHVASVTELYLQVKDADVGAWSGVLYAFRSCTFTFVILATLAYVEGITDNLQRLHEVFLQAFALVFLLGYAVSYYMAVLRRLDDEMVGVCRVPLDILMDQKEHTLLLTLQQDESSTESNTKRNQSGGFGIIRVKLLLSEH